MSSTRTLPHFTAMRIESEPDFNAIAMARDLQMHYQYGVYLTLSRWVSVICFLISAFYCMSASLESNPWSLIIGILFGITSIFTFATKRFMSVYKFSNIVLVFLGLASTLVFMFSLFQPPEFVVVGMMGAAIVIILASFLETAGRARVWSMINILGYLTVVLLHNLFDIPHAELHGLHDILYFGIPVAAIVVIAALAHVTIEHFQSNLLISEARRQYLLSQSEKLKTMTDELTRSNRELEQFAYIASHDLQEPLRKIKTFGTRLEAMAGESLGEREQDYLNRMVNAASRMQTLIEGLLSFSRVHTHAHDYHVVDLNKVVKSVVSDLEMTIEKHGAVLEVNELPNIYGDEQQMRQLFQNLIGNAIKYSKADVPPHIRLASDTAASQDSVLDRKMVQLLIEDNGIGFEQRYADQIFGMFQRLHGRQMYEGSGIGLAICRKIVEQHSGTIRAESEPDVGTKFIVQLPVAAD